ncbi:zf-HC2 domain-containing protein [Promicromonospora soli]
MNTASYADAATALESLSAPAPATVDSGATSVHDLDASECRSTRAAMHDYLNRRLQPRRQRQFEAHMDGCVECIRAFIDIRERSWKRRTAGQPSRGGRSSTARKAGPRGCTS